MIFTELDEIKSPHLLFSILFFLNMYSSDRNLSNLFTEWCLVGGFATSPDKASSNVFFIANPDTNICTLSGPQLLFSSFRDDAPSPIWWVVRVGRESRESLVIITVSHFWETHIFPIYTTGASSEGNHDYDMTAQGVKIQVIWRNFHRTFLLPWAHIFLKVYRGFRFYFYSSNK